MKKENFNNGAFVFSRSIFNSDIWFMPPEYFKIWFYLCGKAAHSTKIYHGYKLERGQYFCNYEELNNQLSYMIGYRKKSVHENLMKGLLKYLRNEGMIRTTKQPRGILVEVLNYNDYQVLKNYEHPNEAHHEAPNEAHHEAQTFADPLTRIKKNLKIKEKREREGETPLPPRTALPAFEKIFELFKKENQSQAEAEAFYCYYQAHGKRMADWPAAVRNWLKKADKFNKSNPDLSVGWHEGEEPKELTEEEKLNHYRSKLNDALSQTKIFKKGSRLFLQAEALAKSMETKIRELEGDKP